MHIPSTQQVSTHDVYNIYCTYTVYTRLTGVTHKYIASMYCLVIIDEPQTLSDPVKFFYTTSLEHMLIKIHTASCRT